MENVCEKDEYYLANIKIPVRQLKVLRVGRKLTEYLNYDENNSGDISKSSSSDAISDIDFEVDMDYLKSLDPKHWKDQDHYAVLGLKHLR